MRETHKADVFKDEYTDIMYNLYDDFYEWQQCDVGMSVKGNIKKHITFWQENCSNKFIIDTISNGYAIPFLTLPQRMFSKNNSSSLNHTSFVKEAIDQLLTEGSIIQCQEKPKVVNPLSVAVQSSGKKRLILDLRKVNYHVWKQSVKYEDLKMASLYLRQGKYLFSFDLKSGYHHIDMLPDHTQYLGFAWCNTYYKIMVLPFGLTSAPYIFTKIMRCLVKKWRTEGKEIIVYLDDGLGMALSFAEAKNQSNAIRKDLNDAGFIVNEEKSQWEPELTCKWLGFQLDTQHGLICPLSNKSRRIVANSTQYIKCRQVQVKLIASIIGKIIAMAPALGNITRLMTRALLNDVQSAPSWYHAITLSEQSKQELNFWSTNIYNLKPVSMRNTVIYHKMVFSDASDLGEPGYIVGINKAVSHGAWNCYEKVKSSTWKELRAVQLVLESFIPYLSGNNVKWFTDNQNVVKIIEIGSGKPELQLIARSIYSVCIQYGISLRVEWIPRSQNEKADALSRIVDYDDWAISHTVFSRFEMLWGPHSIDRFADHENKKTIRFNSRFWNPHSESIDAFTENWAGENNWLVPPISIIAMTILQLESSKATGTLIVPKWPSAPFWPLLVQSHDGSFIPQVVDTRVFPASYDSFVCGKSGRPIFKEKFPTFSMLALRISFA